jgi:chromatin remodeling complex protein RSC6|tara:strand:- start:52 stop:510 length:459 start_codon:yes stop_codon:yes gene_type:complete
MEQYSEKFNGIVTTLTTLKGQITSLQQQIKKLECEVKKDLEKNYKEIEKKKKKKSERKPSGFAKPSKITEDLALFMNKDKDELVARTDVTKFIIEYIKKHDLQNKDDRRKIEPDDILKKLLNVDSELNYFNLQKYMNVHFPKSEFSEGVLVK